MTKLWKADLRGAKLQRADLSSAQLQCIQWGEDAQLQDANLKGAKLQGANLAQVVLPGANLAGSKLQGADLMSANLLGADLRSAQVGSASFKYATVGVNDFRKLSLTPLFDKKDFENWKENMQSLGQTNEEYFKNRQTWLQSRVEKSTIFPENGFDGPCLADTPVTKHFQRCQAQKTQYFKTLASFLGDLACNPKMDIGYTNNIAQGVAKQSYEGVMTEEEVMGEGTPYLGRFDGEGGSELEHLALRLLQPDCAGQAGLNDNDRSELSDLIGAPPSQPPAANKPNRRSATLCRPKNKTFFRWFPNYNLDACAGMLSKSDCILLAGLVLFRA